MVTARSINYPGRRAFSRDLKLKARSPGACLYSASSCSQGLGIAESLLGILKRQYEQQGDNMPFRAIASGVARLQNCVACA